MCTFSILPRSIIDIIVAIDPNCYAYYHVCHNNKSPEEYHAHASANGTTGSESNKYTDYERAIDHASENLLNIMPNNVSNCNCQYDGMCL